MGTPWRKVSHQGLGRRGRGNEAGGDGATDMFRRLRVRRRGEEVGCVMYKETKRLVPPFHVTRREKKEGTFLSKTFV